MSAPAGDTVRTERTFPRFTAGQRWEHGLLILTFTVLLLTGLPQKFRDASWSRFILSTPERVELVRSIHHTAAVAFLLEAAYHVGGGLVLLARKRLSGALFPTSQAVFPNSAHITGLPGAAKRA